MFSHVDTRGRPKALADGTLNEKKKKKKSLSKQKKKKKETLRDLLDLTVVTF